jgi:hypothetical protein
MGERGINGKNPENQPNIVIPAFAGIQKTNP